MWIVWVSHDIFVVDRMILIGGGGVGTEKSAGDGWIAMLPGDYPCGRFHHDVLLEQRAMASIVIGSAAE